MSLFYERDGSLSQVLIHYLNPTMSDSATISVLTQDGVISLPHSSTASVMETLRQSAFIQGLCDGQKLCTTCHVSVISHTGDLPSASEEELEILEMFDNIIPSSRLSCQLRLDPGQQIELSVLEG